MPKKKKRNPEGTPICAALPSTDAADKPMPARSKKALTESRFPVVGIGASAGGLAAIEAFFSAIPAETETGMAFVLVQHLAPDHKSMLSELIRRYTRMKIHEAVDGMKVAADNAYIIPPTATWRF
jgi:two-component system CheB/CheR fusion protein